MIILSPFLLASAWEFLSAGHTCAGNVGHIWTSMGCMGSCSCHKSQGRHPRHNAINGIIHRSLTAAGVPCQVEPQGLSRNDGKRSDGVTLLPWINGRPLICSHLLQHGLRQGWGSSRCSGNPESSPIPPSPSYPHICSCSHRDIWQFRFRYTSFPKGDIPASLQK